MEENSIGMFALLFQLVILTISVVSLWKVFIKAGQPGWAAIVPFYNMLVLLKIAGKPWWWLLILFVPIVNLVIAFLIMKALAEAFGKGTGFAVGLFCLGFIFFPILAFGEAQYGGQGEPPPPDAETP